MEDVHENLNYVQLCNDVSIYDCSARVGNYESKKVIENQNIYIQVMICWWMEVTYLVV